MECLGVVITPGFLFYERRIEKAVYELKAMSAYRNIPNALFSAASITSRSPGPLSLMPHK